MASTTNFGYNIGDVLKEYLDDPIFILNKDYEFEYITENFLLKHLGLNSIGGKMTDILQPNYSQRAVNFLQKVLKFEQAVEIMRVRYGDNSKFYEFKGRLFKNDAQEIKYLITTRDVTQFKKKEEDWSQKKEDLKKLTENMQEIRFWKLLQTKDEKNSFHKSREMLDLVIDNIPQFIYWKNKEMVYVGCNQNYALINNLDDPNFIVGKTDSELPWSRLNFDSIYEREKNLMQNNQSETITEFLILSDGNEAWFEINRIPLHNINNDIVGILCTYNDIMKKVRAERKSIAFEKKYRQIIDNIKEPYFEVDLEGNFTYMNKSFTQMYGYSFDEMVRKNYVHLMDEENGMKVFKKFNLVYKSSLPQENFQFEIIKKGNTKAIVETSVYLNKDTSGRKIGFYGITRDITQRIELELQLKQSEEKYRHLFESSPYAIWIVDLNGVLIDCNPTTNIMFSKGTREDLVGKHFVEVLGMLERPEYFIPFFKSQFKSFVQDKQMNELEFKMTRSDGIEKWINMRSSKIKMEDKTLIQVIMQDITEKKIADLKLQKSEEKLKILNKELEKKAQERTKELRESEQKFRTIAENSLMGVAILQDNKIKYVNQKFATLAGYDVAEVKEFTLMDIFRSIHPDDRKLVMEQLRKKQQGLSDYISHYQYRIFDKTRAIKWVDNYSKTINFMGSPADLVSAIDITDRKKAEQELKESEEKYRSLFENMNTGFAYHEVIVNDDNKPIDYRYIEANSQFEKLTGLKVSDIIGKRVTELLPGIENDPADWIGRYGNVALTGEPLAAENYAETLDRWYKVSGYSPKKGFFAVNFSDITDRKRAEKKLKQSEEKFRTITEHSTIGIVIVQDNKVKYVNKAMLAINEYTLEEVLKWTAKELLSSFHPEDQKQAIDYMKGTQTGDSALPAYSSYRTITKSGKIKWVDSYSKTITYQGRLAVLALISDVTSQNLAKQELKESEKKYRHLFENAPFSIVLLNFEGKIIEMNVATTKLFGYQEEDLIDKKYLTIANLFPKETIPGLRLVDDLMSKGEPSDPITKPQITKIYNKDKSVRWVASELSTVTISGELMILAIIQDITEKKLAEEKLKESERILRQQNIELKELDRLKTDFISIAAHDLKTPLISVGGYVDLILLREKELKDEVKEDLNRVLNNVHRLDGYINRLLDVMKIEAKKVEIVKREENIHDIISDCLYDLEFQVSQKNLTVNVDISDNLNMRVDNFRISQVLINLLSNAVKFTPKNGKIDISVVEEDKNILFKIKDNGKGLTLEEIQKLFGKFVTIEQGVDGYSTLDKGSGLGLYIARGFIEAHGGKIWVESKGRDLGAEFIFTLPKQ